MWEEYYKPLPDADRYLERIGARRRTELTKEYIDELVRAHQCAVPFETTYLSEYGREIKIDTDSLYRKIVEERRGGYCFELNGLFVLLLQALGFDAWSCPCRVIMGANDGDCLPPVFHRGNIVRIGDALWFCDVGFGGPMPMGAVELGREGVQEIGGERFFSVPSGHGIFRLKRENAKGKAENVLYISVARWEPTDFIGPNAVCSAPGGRFSSRTVSLRTEAGYISLTGDEYSVMENGKLTRRQVSREEGGRIIGTVFGL